MNEVAKIDQNVQAAQPTIKAPEKEYFASIFPGPDTKIPKEFAQAIIALEKKLEMPIWVLVQNGSDAWNSISLPVYKGFQVCCRDIKQHEPAGLLIESNGGQADVAYRIARLFQRRSSELTTIVPQYAKSAATLLALAGKKIILGREAELGPLDVQVYDDDREGYDSALNAVQALERLNAFSLSAFDQTMQLLVGRTRKRTEVLLPLALNYVCGFVKPLLEKIDTIDFTKKSRELKIGAQYAVRLMLDNYKIDDAAQIADTLVENYSDHGFVIDREEATSKRVSNPVSGGYGLGLNVSEIDEELDGIFNDLTMYLDSLTVIGRIKEMQRETD